jgi:triosephosphate isomerase
MKPNLVIANWKMNGDGRTNAALLKAIAAALPGGADIDVAVCPPFPYLASVEQQLRGTGIRLGAQNVSAIAAGAFTGEVSAAMLSDIGCQYVLVGHSERRALFGEDDGVLALKFAAALDHGLTPVLCVGETLDERRAGITHRVVSNQITAVIEHVGIDKLKCGVIAYEPVWAIGTGETASPAQAQAVHRHIREVIKRFSERDPSDVQIIYGGSVKADNASTLFSQPDIDGGLIGGASLDAFSFIAICNAARAHSRGEA